MVIYEAEITGKTPLMMHKMDDEALEKLLGSKTVKGHRSEYKTPREIAERHAYKTTDGKFYVPSEWVMSAIKYVATDYKQKNSARKTYKSLITGAMRPADEYSIIHSKKDEAVDCFEVDIKKGVGMKGAIAVCRPRFDEWKIRVQFEIEEDLVHVEDALTMLTDAGRRSGMGSYRVNRGGMYGQFLVTEWVEINRKNDKLEKKKK